MIQQSRARASFVCRHALARGSPTRPLVNPARGGFGLPTALGESRQLARVPPHGALLLLGECSIPNVPARVRTLIAIEGLAVQDTRLDCIGHCRRARGCVEPLEGGIVAQPRELALSEVARRALDVCHARTHAIGSDTGVFAGLGARRIEQLDRLLVPDRASPAARSGRCACVEQPRSLLEQTAGHHVLHAGVDAAVELLPRAHAHCKRVHLAVQGGCQRCRGVHHTIRCVAVASGQGVARAQLVGRAEVTLGHAARSHHDLHCATQPVVVVAREPSAACGIARTAQRGHRCVPLGLLVGIRACGSARGRDGIARGRGCLGGALGGRWLAVEVPSQVHARPARDDDGLAPVEDVARGRSRLIEELARREILAEWRAHVEQPVRDAAALLGGRFGAADIKPLVHLHAVGRDDLAAEAPRKLHRERCLA
mmetsp:Transcript_13042/g.54642  ORF Transcript_13042/g.54642 Transcript_13042/m.54642 type:complete len:427 (-) Transcript_13042:111-1391(-)